MKKYVFIPVFIIGFLALIQTTLAEVTKVEDEKAVFAYFKLTDQIPNFNRWIKNSAAYKDARNAEKDKIFNTNSERLGLEFNEYDIENGLITIRANIRMTTYVDQNGQRLVNTRFIDDRHNETPYFPVKYGNESIAFIIQGLENYKRITLKPEEIPKIKQYFHDSAPYEAVMEIRARPLSADAKEKLLVDYKDQWLMLGDIAYLKIEFYDDFKLENIAVWDYNAPWYLEESQKSLLDMFKNPDSDKDSK